MEFFDWYVPSESGIAVPPYVDLLERGEYEAALPAIQQAIGNDDAFAMSCYGALLAMGRGCTKDISEAALWFRQAAVRGNVNGQTAMGICLATGNGAPLDLGEAAYWLYRGGKGGSLVAVEVLGKLAEDNPWIIGEHFSDRDLAVLVVESRKLAFAKLGKEYPSGRDISRDKPVVARGSPTYH
jgi:TPR repeat protein